MKSIYGFDNHTMFPTSSYEVRPIKKNEKDKQVCFLRVKDRRRDKQTRFNREKER